VSSVCGTVHEGAQAPDETLPELRIEIMSIGAGMSLKYSATLERIQDRRRIGSADLAPDGFLRFRDVPYGECRLTVISGDGAPAYQDQIAVNSSTCAVMLNLPARITPPTVSGTVSLAQLRQPIQKKALSSFRASQKLFDRGDYDGALRELKRAIAASPGYVDAYRRLAALHFKLGLYEQALNEIAQAMNIAGPSPRDLSNMALADYNLGRYADSAEAARSALRLDPNYDPAHFVLGVTLAIDKRTMAESVPHLERAARTITSAKAILAIVERALSED
jgi:tetratricopeptide (TPR) repeat protein